MPDFQERKIDMYPWIVTNMVATIFVTMVVVYTHLCRHALFCRHVHARTVRHE